MVLTMKYNKRKKSQGAKKKSKNIFIRYKYPIIITILVLIIGYVAIKFLLIGNTMCNNENQNNLIGFTGDYLAASATVVIGLLSVLQSHYFSETQMEREKERRIKTIQPLFSLEIKYDGDDGALSIENVGKYPISNVFICDKYMYGLLNTNEKKTLKFVYSNSIKRNFGGDTIELYELEYPASAKDVPKDLIITYDDIDGNCMYQEFELKEFEKIEYYSLEKTECAFEADKHLL